MANSQLLIDIRPVEDNELTIRTAPQSAIDSSSRLNKKFSPFYATGDMVDKLSERLKLMGVAISQSDLMLTISKELSDAFGFDIAERVVEVCEDYQSMRQEFEQMFAAGMAADFFEKYSTTFTRVYGDISTVFDELVDNLHDGQQPDGDDKPLDDMWKNWGDS